MCGLRYLTHLSGPHGAKEAAIVTVLLIELHTDIDELKEWKQTLLLFATARAMGARMRVRKQ
jgi:hypothetical protein